MRIALAATLILASLPAATSAARLQQIGQHTQAFRKLGDKAKLPAARNHPFIEVWTGGYSMPTEGKYRAITWHGLLLEDNGKTFRVLLDRFREQTFTRTKPGTAEYRQVRYKPTDLKAAALARLAGKPNWDGTVDLFYGYVCDGSGHDLLAEQLFDRVPQASKHRANGLGFATAAALDLGFARYEDALARFADTDDETDQRQTRLDIWLAAFDNHQLADEVRELRAALLRSLAKEPPVDASAAAQLVHELTSFAGGIATNSGWPFVMPRPGGKRPSDRLVAMGAAAAPALLEALTDDRPTRCVRGTGSRQMYSQVMRVDRVALQVIEAIAGLGHVHAEPAKAKPLYTAWLRRVEQVGELEDLLRRTKMGSPAAANRLVELAPDRAAEAIRSALQFATDNTRRTRLMEIAQRSKGAATTKLLREILASQDPLAVAAVAEPLLKKPEQRRPALEALRQAWRAAAVDSREAAAVAPLLCKYGDPESINLLLRIPAALTGRELQLLPLPTSKPQPGQAVVAAHEQLLRSLLTTTRERYGVVRNILNPRPCDFAAHELARRWPGRFRFDITLLRADRNLALKRLRGEPVIEQPVALPDAAKEQLAAWDKEHLASERERIVAAITDPLALTTLRLRRNKAHAARRTELDNACRRVASTVLIVGPKDELAKLPPGMAEQFRALIGKPLDPGHLANLLGSVVASPADGAREQSFEILRRGNGPGITIQLRSVAGTSAVRERPQYNATLAYGRRITMNTAGASVRDAVRRGVLATFAERLQDAIDAEDEEPIEAHVRLTQRH